MLNTQAELRTYVHNNSAMNFAAGQGRLDATVDRKAHLSLQLQWETFRQLLLCPVGSLFCPGG
jgi:hypothetical protein